mmetsp:Transcript_48774/g.156199  ORF Transcript_48774/g.156199 Transcript_48774/m.156199 type:complete len:205 (+) Transcript_48774:1123-1737(+)
MPAILAAARLIVAPHEVVDGLARAHQPFHERHCFLPLAQAAPIEALHELEVGGLHPHPREAHLAHEPRVLRRQLRDQIRVRELGAHGFGDRLERVLGHGVRGVEADPVRVVLAQVDERAVLQHLDDLLLPERELPPPGGVAAPLEIDAPAALVPRPPVVIPEGVVLRRAVVEDGVKEHRNPLFVAGIHKVPHILGGPVGRVRRQ